MLTLLQGSMVLNWNLQSSGRRLKLRKIPWELGLFSLPTLPIMKVFFCLLLLFLVVVSVLFFFLFFC